MHQVVAEVEVVMLLQAVAEVAVEAMHPAAAVAVVAAQAATTSA
jgi:hypothetical protein